MKLIGSYTNCQMAPPLTAAPPTRGQLRLQRHTRVPVQDSHNGCHQPTIMRTDRRWTGLPGDAFIIKHLAFKSQQHPNNSKPFEADISRLNSHTLILNVVPCYKFSFLRLNIHGNCYQCTGKWSHCSFSHGYSPREYCVLGTAHGYSPREYCVLGTAHGYSPREYCVLGTAHGYSPREYCVLGTAHGYSPREYCVLGTAHGYSPREYCVLGTAHGYSPREYCVLGTAHGYSPREYCVLGTAHGYSPREYCLLGTMPSQSHHSCHNHTALPSPYLPPFP